MCAAVCCLLLQAKNHHAAGSQGRWPSKSADILLQLLKNAESNADVKVHTYIHTCMHAYIHTYIPAPQCQHCLLHVVWLLDELVAPHSECYCVHFCLAPCVVRGGRVGLTIDYMVQSEANKNGWYKCSDGTHCFTEPQYGCTGMVCVWYGLWMRQCFPTMNPIASISHQTRHL